MIEASMVGRELSRVTFSIERSKLAELARSFHDGDPVWHDSGAARAAGFAAVPVPPTVLVLADHWRAHGAIDAPIRLGADIERLLHGETAFEYLAPITVGDEITATTHVAEISQREGRRGGSMTLVTTETRYVNQHGVLVARRRDTMIETGR